MMAVFNRFRIWRVAHSDLFLAVSLRRLTWLSTTYVCGTFVAELLNHLNRWGMTANRNSAQELPLMQVVPLLHRRINDLINVS